LRSSFVFGAKWLEIQKVVEKLEISIFTKSAQVAKSKSVTSRSIGLNCRRVELLVFDDNWLKSHSQRRVTEGGVVLRSVETN
jgi:hypothetical protein